MDHEQRLAALRQLAREIESIEGADAEDREQLLEVRAELERLLQDEAARPDEGILDRMKHLVERLEEEHPRTAYAIGQAADILGRMGL